MKHFSTYEQVQQVADTFYMIADTVKDDKAVYMDEISVPKGENICGTQACHAGWWLYFSNLNDHRLYNSYGYGAESIAQALGFEDEGELECWAHDNSEIWGNDEGATMFCSGFAFGRMSDYLDLKTIADHWQEVANRVYGYHIKGAWGYEN